jgi:formylglycine-generating enzyme required for sulfatase activity
VVITLWATNNPPTYCAVSLVDTATARFYGSEDEVPFGAADSRWKKDWLLLRKIPSTQGESVTLGSPDNEWARQDNEPPRSVSITRPFYLGVFEVTQRQWEMVGTRSKPSYWNNTTDWEERPVETVSYNEIRGATSGNPEVNVNWPLTGHAVLATSFMGRLRTKTGGILEFDLPTDAQWEYACRVGTTGPWNNGIGASNSETDPNLALLGRCQYNGGVSNSGTSWPQNCLASNATAKVGSYLPNAWGLYDMHGNVWEWCLDWHVSSGTSLSGDNPAGPMAGSVRLQRGGSWDYGASNHRSARRGGNTPSTQINNLGLRVAAPAEVWITQ